MTSASEITVAAGAASDVGLARPNNQDRYLAADTFGPLAELTGRQRVDRGGLFFGVCDGMGGAAAGEVASKLAADTIVAFLSEQESPQTDRAFALALVNAMHAANRAVTQNSRQHPERRGMGTTCTLAGLRNDKLFVAHVGDSRAYLLRAGALWPLTKDHTLAGQAADLGVVRGNGAQSIAQALLQAVGTVERLHVELSVLELRQHDRLLLCSDGLWGMVPDAKLSGVLGSPIGAQECCDMLVTLANAAGGRDNITALVCDLAGPGLRASEASDPGAQPYVLSEDTPSPEAELASLASSAFSASKAAPRRRRFRLHSSYASWFAIAAAVMLATWLLSASIASRTVSLPTQVGSRAMPRPRSSAHGVTSTVNGLALPEQPQEEPEPQRSAPPDSSVSPLFEQAVPRTKPPQEKRHPAKPPAEAHEELPSWQRPSGPIAPDPFQL